MFPQQWSSPCGNQCTHKYAALMQIPYACTDVGRHVGTKKRKHPTIDSVLVGRVFCKKGCNADGETWEECLGECNEICYKDPVFKDQQWSAYIDRSPGADNYSVECFHACVAGCGYKFSIPSETVDQVHPKRPAKPCPVSKPPPSPPSPPDPLLNPDDVPCTSA